MARSIFCLCLLALLSLSTSCLSTPGPAPVCSFSFATTTGSGTKLVGSGFIQQGTQSCASNVLSGTPPQMKGQSINQCGWPSGTVTGSVTVTGSTQYSGTSTISNAAAGSELLNVQCNLQTGSPYALGNQGLLLASTFGGQLHQFKLYASQQYRQQGGGNQSAPYANVVNGYKDELINGVGNFTLCCTNFQSADGCYGATTTPTPAVSLNASPSPTCNAASSSSPSSSSPNIAHSDTVHSAIVGDPQFVGLRGQQYQIHGIDGAVYNIISHTSWQLNSRFKILTGPRTCPSMPSTGKRSSACWAHDGSYLQNVGVQTDGGDQLYVESGPASSGFAAVTLNGQSLQLQVGDTVPLDFSADSGLSGHVTLNNTHELTLQVGAWRIELENSDAFLNLRSVAVQAKLSTLTTHGLLGQTWRMKSWGGATPAVEGRINDYVVLEDEVWGTDFLYNRFRIAELVGRIA